MKEQALREVLDSLTLAEKVGQLVQVTPDFFDASGAITGPMLEWTMSNQERYQIGSVLGTTAASQVREIQAQYLAQSRHKIPLLFMADVIHGYREIFPIPLALASSFDEELVESVARASAKEAAGEGIHVTFSPMADYVKDSRWGRVLESNGEDPLLSQRLTAAYVKGYQGDNLQDESSLAACVKHFIGYGAAEGGRDYNTVDFSDLVMYQDYLPSFRSALAAGAKLVMTAFNSVRGVPVSGNQSLIQQVLREDLAFDGVLISDWAAIQELIAHRVAENQKEAATMAFKATVDMDMMTSCYQRELATIVTEQHLEHELDEAVWRVLTLKNELGLFENPYRGLDKLVATAELQEQAFEAAVKSAVLLKNEQVLPLQKNEKILLVGTKVATGDLLGAWSCVGDTAQTSSLASVFQTEFSQLTSIPLAADASDLAEKWPEIQAAALAADKVVIAVGEAGDEAGEAASKTSLRLKPQEIDLIQQLGQLNQHCIGVIFSGRPLVLTDVVDHLQGIIAPFFLGSQTSGALAALLSGRRDFSGRLAMGFPRHEGQLPYSYREMSTGRPETAANHGQRYLSNYLDEENDALYPFGYGLSYNTWEYQDITLSQEPLTKDAPISLRLTVTNQGTQTGSENIQLYFTDEVAQVIRPKIELLDWQLVSLAPGESREICFVIHSDQLAYVHQDLRRYPDSGRFQLHLGKNSREILANFTVEL
ncbi:glycoside hydrolase family 3 N-terminal domain-containing protein [Enterococcus asini]|uniref:glycoside hydrolase family 3 N-terminal domain-containing protein n=1 Tax=Enterococcus asini TaxID=57732 RepID=UPI0028928D4E|nr:glycoside hydrolase family 3 N-terminal domain-containing protein [Enterococcus asini]MDT2784167.1 glycoside hydrolase family 3 N-terminal domain-containing protein [Enterococcus asini]